MASWEYAFAMAGGANGGGEHPVHRRPAARTEHARRPDAATCARSWPSRAVPVCGVRFRTLTAGPGRTSVESRRSYRRTGSRRTPRPRQVSGKESAWLTTGASPTWARARSRCRTSTSRPSSFKDGPGVNPANVGRQLPHAAILKVVSTNICGSDQHMVRGRTTAPEGLILGHEITGEVIETGPDVEFIKEGDLCLGAVQHRLRPLPQLQGGQHRRLPERQPRPARLGVRLRRHGRLGRRPGRVRRSSPTRTGTS